MGSNTWLKVDLDLLQSGLRAAREAREKIAASAAGYDVLSDAVGHDNLKRTLDEFGGNWSIHRRRLLDELDTLAGNIAHTYEKFYNEDIANSQVGGGGQQTPADQTPRKAPPQSEPPAPMAQPAPAPAPAPAPGPGPASPPMAGTDEVGPAAADPTPAMPPAPGGSGSDKNDKADAKTPGLPPNVNPDTASFNALLDVWSKKAEALVKLGLPITALGAGAVALLALFGRLPSGYHLNPDGTVTRQADATSTGTLDPKAAGNLLGGVDGQTSGSAPGDQPITAADVEGLLAGATDPAATETDEGIDGQAASPADPAATDAAGPDRAVTDPTGAESGAATHASPDGSAESVAPPLAAPTEPLSGGGAPGGSSAPGTPVMPPPPMGSASSEAHAAMGEATQRLDQLAAPAAAAAAVGAATLRGSDAEAALATVRQEQAAHANTQSAAQTRMAAMSSLSAVSHQLSQVTGSSPASGHAASSAASSTGAATRRSASEALEALEKPKDEKTKDKAK